MISNVSSQWLLMSEKEECSYPWCVRGQLASFYTRLLFSLSQFSHL